MHRTFEQDSMTPKEARETFPLLSIYNSVLQEELDSQRPLLLLVNGL